MCCATDRLRPLSFNCYQPCKVSDEQNKMRDFGLLTFPILAEAKLKEIKVDASNLNVLELIQLCNKYVSALAPKEEPVNVLKTKSEKKAAGGKGAGKKR